MAGVLLLTAGCGSDSSEDGATGTTVKQKTPIEAVLASATKTAEAKSSKVAFSLVTQGLPGVPGGSLSITGEGAFDYAGRQGAFTSNVPPFGQIEVVSTGSTVYQKFPPQVAADLGGKPWVKMDLNQLGKDAGIDFDSISQASSGDPTQALQFLRGSADITEVGKEQVRGEAVTHYRGTIDLNKAAATAPPEQQPTYQELAQLYAQPLPVEVWIDGQDRLRKVSYVVDLAKLNLPQQPAAEAESAAAKPTGTLSFTTELFEFGTPVSVTIPPTDQVTDFAQLRAAGGGRR